MRAHQQLKHTHDKSTKEARAGEERLAMLELSVQEKNVLLAELTRLSRSYKEELDDARGQLKRMRLSGNAATAYQVGWRESV